MISFLIVRVLKTHWSEISLAALSVVPFEGATYAGAAVGFRPARSEVRLEADRLGDGRLLVHDYGHGGSGFTLSWGCADEVTRLVLGNGAA